jgi:23S rRNA (pseudouridine1915-N3)-methyltransferase
MKISISAVGKLIKPWMQDGVDTYLARIPRGYSITMDLIAPYKSNHNHPEIITKEKEAEKLLATANFSEYWIALDSTGKQLDSMEWPKQLQTYSQSAPIRFFIGGAYGLDTSLINQCKAIWSLGKLTMPHGLARVVLIEQLYRALSIINNHPYHKE